MTSGTKWMREGRNEKVGQEREFEEGEKNWGQEKKQEREKD